MTVKKALNNLATFVLLLTPLFGLETYLSNLGVRAEWLKAFTYLKVLKDIVFVLLFAVAIVDVFSKRMKRPILGYAFVLFFFAAVGIAHALMLSPLFLIGFRAFLPFSVLIYAFFRVDPTDITHLYRATRFVFYALFVSLFFEYFFFNTWGKGLLGFNKRACGFLFYPSPAAGFVVFFYWMRSQMTGKKNIIVDILVVASLVMISSAMGYLLFFVVFVLLRVKSRHYFVAGLVLAPLGLFFLFSVYPAISNRHNFDTSIFTRLSILQKSIHEGGLLGVAPGYGTNLFIRNFSVDFVQPEMIDNTFASLNWQYGTLASFLVLALIGFNLLREAVVTMSRKPYVDGLLIFAIMGSSIPLQEFFPINLLLPMVIAYYYRETTWGEIVQ